MWRFVRASLPVAIFALVTIAASPAWAPDHVNGGSPPSLPAPAVGGLIVAAIIGAIIAAKLRRRE